MKTKPAKPNLLRTEWVQHIDAVDGGSAGKATLYKTNFGFQINVILDDGQIYPRAYVTKFPIATMENAEASALHKFLELQTYFREAAEGVEVALPTV